MTVKSRGTYDFPSRSRQELYDGDILVSLWFQDTMWWCSPLMFRAPTSMRWGDFWSQMVVPLAEEDPDFDPAAARIWSVHGTVFEPEDHQTLAELRIGHKDVIGTRLAA